MLSDVKVFIYLYPVGWYSAWVCQAHQRVINVDHNDKHVERREHKEGVKGGAAQKAPEHKNLRGISDKRNKDTYSGNDKLPSCV